MLGRDYEIEEFAHLVDKFLFGTEEIVSKDNADHKTEGLGTDACRKA